MGVTLEQFDPTTIKPGSVVVITARRNSGKTVLLRDCMYHLRKSIDCTVCMTQSVSSAEMFRQHVPASCVHENGLDLAVIEKLLAAQRASLAAGKRPRNVLLVLDDVSNDKALRAKGNTLGDCSAGSLTYLYQVAIFTRATTCKGLSGPTPVALH